MRAFDLGWFGKDKDRFPNYDEHKPVRCTRKNLSYAFPKTFRSKPIAYILMKLTKTKGLCKHIQNDDT